ncbi:MAG: CotH kinase family protein [Myxococcota bacterium]
MSRARFVLVGVAWACDADPPAPVDLPVVECAGVEHVPGPSVVFDDRTVHQLRLSLPAETRAALGAQTAAGDDTDYPAELQLGAVTRDVGIRLKGSSTFQPLADKPNLKIDVDAFVADQDLYGVEGFDLANGTYDASAMKEHLAYRAFREANLPASRTGWAQVWIDDVDYGLYTIVEQQNGDYLEQWWDDTTGSVYESEGGCDLVDLQLLSGGYGWELDRSGGGDTEADLWALGAAAETSPDAWFDAIGREVDWPVVARSLALEAVIGHWDSYSGGVKNTRLYHEPTVDRWTYTPWSTDLAFASFGGPSGGPRCGAALHEDPAEYTHGVLVERCLADAACSASLDQARAEMAAHLRCLDLPAEIDRVAALLRPFVGTSPKGGYTQAEFDAEVACLEAWLADRPAAWGVGAAAPFAPGPVINELLASNAAGIRDADGEADDWIELYNPGDQDLPLAGYRLGGDLDGHDATVLGSLTLPAGGFVVLWADGDAAAGPDHLGFALDRDGEAIALYAPDGAPLDRVRFRPQDTDVSAGRYPDGSQALGAWSTGAPTPGSPNAGP